MTTSQESLESRAHRVARDILDATPPLAANVSDSTGAPAGTATGTPTGALTTDCLLFLLHAADRLSFDRLGEDKRRLFMNAVVAAVALELDRNRPDAFSGAYNDAQLVYGPCRALLPREAEPMKGTACWAFAQLVAARHEGLRPVPLTAVAQIAASNVEGVGDILTTCNVTTLPRRAR